MGQSPYTLLRPGTLVLAGGGEQLAAASPLLSWSMGGAIAVVPCFFSRLRPQAQEGTGAFPLAALLLVSRRI